MVVHKPEVKLQNRRARKKKASKCFSFFIASIRIFVGPFEIVVFSSAEIVPFML